MKTLTAATTLLLVLTLVPAVSFAQERTVLSKALRHIDLAELSQAAPPPERDSLLNGTLIGAAVGFGAGFLGMAVVNAKETASGPIWDHEAFGIYTMAGIIGAGIGAGIGALLDALHRGPRFRPSQRTGSVALTPVRARGRTGAVLSIRY